MALTQHDIESENSWLLTSSGPWSESGWPTVEPIKNIDDDLDNDDLLDDEDDEDFDDDLGDEFNDEDYDDDLNDLDDDDLDDDDLDIDDEH